jgi:hypothetical protein
LDVSNCQLDDLDGIEFFEYLEYLNAAGNNISDVTPLSMHMSIQGVDLSMNNIDDDAAMEFLSTLPQLTELDVSGNPITELADYDQWVTTHLCRVTRVIPRPSMQRVKPHPPPETQPQQPPPKPPQEQQCHQRERSPRTRRARSNSSSDIARRRARPQTAHARPCAAQWRPRPDSANSNASVSPPFSATYPPSDTMTTTPTAMMDTNMSDTSSIASSARSAMSIESAQSWRSSLSRMSHISGISQVSKSSSTTDDLQQSIDQQEQHSMMQSSRRRTRPARPMTARPTVGRMHTVDLAGKDKQCPSSSLVSELIKWRKSSGRPDSASQLTYGSGEALCGSFVRSLRRRRRRHDSRSSKPGQAGSPRSPRSPLSSFSSATSSGADSPMSPRSPCQPVRARMLPSTMKHAAAIVQQPNGLSVSHK